MKYRYHWLFKLLALVLAMVSGAALVLGATGLILDQMGYYELVRHTAQFDNINSYCDQAAGAVFDRFAWKDTDIEPKLFERFFRWGADVDAVEGLAYEFCYAIYEDGEKLALEANYSGEQEFYWNYREDFSVRRGFVTVMPMAQYYPGFHQYRSAGEDMAYVDLTGQALPPLGDGVISCEYYVVSGDPTVNRQNISMPNYNHDDAKGAEYTIYRMEYTGYDHYEVRVGLTQAQYEALKETTPVTQDFLTDILVEYRPCMVPVVTWSGVVLALCCLWLALVAGKSPYRSEVRAEGLNRILLDLYTAGAVACGIGLGLLGFRLAESMIWESINGDLGQEVWLLHLIGLALTGCGGGLLLAMLAMAASAQMKMGGSYWLKHTCIGLCWRGVWKAVKWCLGTVRKVVGGILRGLRRLVGWIPLTWQWLLLSGGLWLLMLLCCLMAYESWSAVPILLGVAVTAAVVCYGAYGFGALRSGAKKLSGGNLEDQIENQYLLGCFGDFAADLNALGDACVHAAREQMKSERMKTELITNVSHDIKTPLTSIINYVDLLQRTDDEAQRAEYLEVLDRQSQKLKKLIEDLMDMSKASSGNVAVEITPTDVCEAVNQALGEFADALERCGLTLMLKTPAEPAMALCDGRHLWRVLGNCLGNTVKYAMPGTRVYVDVEKRDRKVEVSIKNISAQMLNIQAEELMERFVRGDSSRNTEGNGLGLNIAKSLMELQGGRLDLKVDGDLFKVVLTLNAE